MTIKTNEEASFTSFAHCLVNEEGRVIDFVKLTESINRLSKAIELRNYHQFTVNPDGSQVEND